VLTDRGTPYIFQCQDFDNNFNIGLYGANTAAIMPLTPIAQPQTRSRSIDPSRNSI
jgi:hypothetical protein